MKSFGILLSAIVLAASAGMGSAEEAASEGSKPPEPLKLEEPASVDVCLGMLEKVIEHALGADLLDDQIDKSELELERMESACYDKRFPEALDAAKMIVAIVATNK